MYFSLAPLAEWTAYSHPDPDGVQLQTLQNALVRLMAGKTSVENSISMQILSKTRGAVGGADWAEMVPDMYVWIDFCSMAQPSAGHMPYEDEKVAAAAAEADKAAERVAAAALKAATAVSVNEKTVAVDAQGAEIKNTYDSTYDEVQETKEEQKTANHRRHEAAHGSGEAAKCLSNGVASLPGYVELSDLIIVLVPTTMHKDRVGEPCDFGSWRGRGWCRLEFMATVLSPTKNRVMIVRGGDAFIEFIPPWDALMLPPGRGEFSCCAANHDFGDGIVVCDRVKMRWFTRVLRLLLDGKIESLFAEGKILDARYFIVLEHWWYRGLFEDGQEGAGGERGSGKTEDERKTRKPKKTRPAKQVSAPVELSTDGVNRVAALRDMLEWRSDKVEKAATKKTGMSLLTWAVLANDLAVVKQLLRDGTASSNKKEVNRGVAVERPVLLLWKKQTPVMLAMVFSRFEIVEALLNAGANPTARTSHLGADAVFLAALTGRADNLTEWLARFPQWDLERRETKTGGTALLNAICFGGSPKMDAVRVLLDAGANIRVRNYLGINVIPHATINLDLGSEDVLRLLLERAPDLLNAPLRATTCKFKVILWLLRFAVRRGVTSKMVKWVAMMDGSTALQTATSYSNFKAMRILCAMPGIDIGARTTQGRTALDLATDLYGGNPPAMYAELLGGGEGGHLAEPPPGDADQPPTAIARAYVGTLDVVSVEDKNEECLTHGY
jgi:ankyrin repeat protein